MQVFFQKKYKLFYNFFRIFTTIKTMNLSIFN
uniref:Uncharacterized protein n=1 Tax=Myoviridae sp. ctEBR14 TaxID=2825060 RepID=A0A8S5NVV1_9CAUD|nr:MAG TPA: hypothetical protein [Myoviridae sp. ctEBR14]